MNMENLIVASVENDDEFDAALSSKVKTIFFLYPDIAELGYIAQKAHRANKNLYIHIDLTNGLGKDKSGIEFAYNSGVDGIISTRLNLIKAANECGLKTVQRIFVMDSHSIDTTIENLKITKADMIEVMPGIATKAIERLKERTPVPIIAGGLIETKEEVNIAISSGACAISTGFQDLWNL